MGKERSLSLPPDPRTVGTHIRPDYSYMNDDVFFFGIHSEFEGNIREIKSHVYGKRQIQVENLSE